MSDQNLVQMEIRLATEKFLAELQGLEARYGSTMKSVTADTASTATALEQSFKVLGVKGVQEVEREVQRLQAALAQIRTSPDVLPADKAAALAAFNKRLSELRAEAAQTPAALGTVRTAADEAGASLADAAHKAIAWTAALAGINSVGDVARNLIATGAEFETLRVRLENLLGGTEKAQAAFNMIKALASTTPFEVTALTETFIKLTAMGLQPTEAQMRSLSDVAANLGGGTEVLAGVTTALGQAWAKGKLQGEEIMQLAERGVPVWDALAKATGRSVPELQRMSEAGTLGRDVITKLIDELGRMNAGASDKLMNTYAGAVSNAKDALAEFYDMVSRSGVLEFLTGKLKELLAEFDRMKQSGELEAKAKAISDTFISLATAVESATTVMVQFWPQIKLVAEAALALKAANMAGTLLSIATGARAAGAGMAAAGAASAASAVQMEAAAVAGGRVATVLRVLRTLTGVGLVLGVAELAQELFRAKGAAEAGDIAVKKMLEEKPGNGPKKAADAAAAALQQTVSKSADLLKSFDAMIEKGDSTSEAIAKIGKDFDLSNAPGIRDAAVVLETLLAQGKITANQFRDAWATSLKDVNLSEFEVRARQAMESTGGDVHSLQQAIDAGLREAIRRAGGDFDALSGGMGKAAQRSLTDVDFIIGNLDRLKAQGADTGTALALSLGKALNTADSQAAVDALKTRIEAMRNVLGDKIADGLLDQAAAKAEDLRHKLDQATGGVNSVREAMEKLGLRSSESLRRAADDAVEAYGVIKQAGAQEGESYLAWQRRKEEAARAMVQRLIDANRGIADAAIIARAAAEGLRVETDATGRSIVKSMGDAEEATNRVGRAAGGAAGSFGAMAQGAAEAAKKIDEINAKYGQSNADREAKYGKVGNGSDLVGKSRDTRFVGMLDTDINQMIAQRYGDDMVDNATARAAIQRRMELDNYRKSYGDVRRSQESLNQQRNIAAELERLEGLIEEEKRKKRGSDSGSGTAGGGNTGDTYVSNITIDGTQRAVRTTDAQSQAVVNDLVRQLAQARGAAIR